MRASLLAEARLDFTAFLLGLKSQTSTLRPRRWLACRLKRMTGGNDRRLPVWAIGLANMPTGFVYGFISTAMGILLAARGVPVAKVGAISGIAFSPSFWAFLLSPVLDVRFTKRAYGFGFAALAATLLGLSVVLVGNLLWFTVALTASCASVVLYASAVSSWIVNILSDAEYDGVSGWLNVANLGAAGAFGAVSVVLIRWLPLPAAAVCLAALVLAPTLLLLYIPAPPRPAGKLRENFRLMGRDMIAALRERRLWVGLLIFLSPIAFALTNLFSTLGADFGVKERAVTTLNGPLVALVCSAGCLLAIPLCRRMRRRTVYLLAGVGAAVAALAMGVLPHTPVVYAGGLLLYNFCQGFNYTAFVALELELVGPGTAVAGTMLAILSASANVPISTMTFVDGRVHDSLGLRAMLFVDAGAALVTVVALFLVAFPLLDRWVGRQQLTIGEGLRPR